MAVAIAVDATDLNTQPAIPQQAIDNFMNGVLSIGHSMTRSWEDTLMYSQLAVSYLNASQIFPERSEYQQFFWK
jgi:hypothetical protein